MVENLKSYSYKGYYIQISELGRLKHIALYQGNDLNFAVYEETVEGAWYLTADLLDEMHERIDRKLEFFKKKKRIVAWFAE